MRLKTLVIIGAAVLALSSCSSSKTVLPYFTDISAIEEGSFDAGNYTPAIKPDDELFISVQSEVPGASAPYNLPMVNPASRDQLTLATTPRQQTYTVDSQGYIHFPILGRIKVEGLTCEQLQAELTKKISADVTDPLVTVKLVNFAVVVAGEVAKPGKILVNGNRISVLDAIGAAGDLTPYGERSNVLVIREENGKRVFHHLDLNSSKTLTSPYFYLQQNDYVYVEPNKVRQANSKYNQDNAYKLTVISTIVSAASVVASLVIALAIK
ncbi:MAG: polysaccharide biosynthesis/export family protein [Muribaculaceae bacterium]|nr:polysaccharide biosynthesis/export family protein [Muribaculaceae bacterium]